ncbi:MAG: hypothetical protein IJ154_02840 [Bacteroidales bacterium]|nr:hypothetical protein [Bacteroidales bacterium]
MKGGGIEGLIAIVVILVILGSVLMYVAIAAGIGLVLFGLFLLCKWLFIGWTKKTKADPLFTIAAKEAVKNKGFDHKRFAKKHSLSYERVKFIITQLRLAGVMDGCEVLIDKQWNLRPVFKSINDADDFFLARIQEETATVLASIDNQKDNESNAELISVIESIRGNADVGMKLCYLKAKLLAIHDYADQSEIDAVSQLIDNISASGGEIDFSEEDETMQRFEDFSSYLTNTSSAKIWNGSHVLTDIAQDSFCDIHINGKPCEVPMIADCKVESFFYPSFVIVLRRYSPDNSFHIFDYQQFKVTNSSFSEPLSPWFDANDASVAYRTWLHSRVTGGPDLRYKNNPSTAYYSFYKAEIAPVGLEVVSGTASVTDNIKKAFKSIKTQLSSAPKTKVEIMMENATRSRVEKPSDDAFSGLQHVYTEMVSVYNTIMANNNLCGVINAEIHMPQPNGKDVEISYKVLLVLFIDFIKCYQGMGHVIDFSKRDSYLLPMATNLKINERLTNENVFLYFMKRKEVEHIYKNLLLSFEGWAKKDGPDFLLTRFAEKESVDVSNQYKVLMMSASDYIQRASPQNTPLEKEWLESLLHSFTGESMNSDNEKIVYHISELGKRIASVIRNNAIPIESIADGSFVSILNDYQIFDSIEEKASAKILRQAVSDGTLSIVITEGPSSIEGINAIKNFVVSTGFDSIKAESIISDVYYGFYPFSE